MIAEGLVTNGAKVYIAARKEKQLKEVEYLMQMPGQILTDLQAADELNKAGPGSCHYIVADLAVRAAL